MVDWSLLNTPNVAGALQAGMQAGREMKRQRVVDSALAAYAANPNDPASTNALIAVAPDLGFKLQDRQREQQIMEARRAVFSPPNAGVPSGVEMPSYNTPGINGMNEDGSPKTILDPSHLPPRTDGLSVNQEALRALYQMDPQSAMDIQRTIYNADKAGMDRMKASGEVMATAAYRLSKLPADQRAAELRAMTPQLVGLGLDPQQIAGADLSDASLERYMTIGRSIKDVMAEDAAKYVSVPAGGTLVNVRDPRAVAAMGGSAPSPIQPGAVVNGKVFKGGDYRDPNNWSGGPTQPASAGFR